MKIEKIINNTIKELKSFKMILGGHILRSFKRLNKYIKKIIKDIKFKVIDKIILKVLNIYMNNLENKKLIFKNNKDRTLFFEIEYLIKLLKIKKGEI